ncbi:hypothetical protein MTO96_041940 [Rhipicephalus appendiculatus]
MERTHPYRKLGSGIAAGGLALSPGRAPHFQYVGPIVADKDSGRNWKPSWTAVDTRQETCQCKSVSATKGVVIQWPSCLSRASPPRSGRLPAAGRTQGRRASSHAGSLSLRLRTATDEDRAAECGYLDDSGLRGSTEILCDRPAMENAATDAAGNAARPRTVAVRCWTVAEADEPLRRGPYTWPRQRRPGRTVVTEKHPPPSAPPPALPDQDLAALCRERIESPNFAAVIGPTPPAAAASAPHTDDGTNVDRVLDLSEENVV